MWPADFFDPPPSTPPASSASDTVAPSAQSAEAHQLRDALLAGNTRGLNEKIAILKENERKFIAQSLVDRATQNIDVLPGLSRLLESDALNEALVAEITTNIVRRSAFTSEILRKVRTLELPLVALSRVDRGVLRAFFADILDIVDRDQFKEVNAIMPALVAVQDAIPLDLHARYFHTLLEQAESRSHHGAPAARRALETLGGDAARTAMKEINIQLLEEYLKRKHLRLFLERHQDLVPSEKDEMITDFLKLPYPEFVDRHVPPPEPDIDLDELLESDD